MSDEVRPIKPEEVVERKTKTLLDEVLSSFNELIIQKWNGYCAIILQDDILRMMVKKGLNPRAIFGNDWLDIIDMYQGAGWKVTYDKPGHNEYYAVQYMFEKRKD